MAESQTLSVVHICVMADSGMSRVQEQAGFTEVRTYLDMLWGTDELAELELPEGYSLAVLPDRRHALAHPGPK